MAMNFMGMATSSRAILVLCTIACTPAGCSGFRQQHGARVNANAPSFGSRHRTKQATTRVHSTASGSADKLIFDDDVRDDVGDDARGYYRGEGSDDAGAVELWLDLRGTSLTPEAALELWHMDDRWHEQRAEGEIPSTKAPFVNFLVSPNEGSRDRSKNGNGGDEGNVDVLRVVAEIDGDGMNLILRESRRSPSSTSSIESVGRILSLRTSSSSMPVLPDPLPAMEVVSEGGWLVVDTDGWKKVEEVDRTDMVLPLVELISSGSECGAGGGGVGLTCRTNNEVVKSAMFIQSMTSNGGVSGRGNARSKTLESGIVIPDYASPDNSGAKRTSFALVVPYDMELLQTAKLLLFSDDS